MLVLAVLLTHGCYFAPGKKGPGRGTNVSSGWSRDEPIVHPPGTPTRTEPPR